MYLHMFRHEQKRLGLRPSEYWRRHCYVEAMFLSRREARMRERIGVANMLWGVAKVQARDSPLVPAVYELAEETLAISIYIYI